MSIGLTKSALDHFGHRTHFSEDARKFLGIAIDSRFKPNDSMMSSISVNVQVNFLGGSSLVFSMRSSQTMWDMMERIWRKQKRFPPSCQKIIFKDDMIECSQTISKLCAESQTNFGPDSHLSFNVIVDCSRLIMLIEAEDHEIYEETSWNPWTGHTWPGAQEFTDQETSSLDRMVAIRDLACLAKQGSLVANDAIFRACEHHQSDVRAMALKTVSEMACKDDRRVLAIALQHLQDGGQSAFRCGNQRKRHGCPVKEESLRSLREVASLGNTDVLHDVMGLLMHSNQYVRKEAIITLMHLASEGDKTVLHAVVTCLQGSPWEFRSAIVSAFGKYENSLVVDILVHCLRDPSAKIRKAALASIASIATKGNARAISALLENQCHKNRHIRRAVVFHLACRWTENSSQVVSALASRLKDWDSCVSSEALKGLNWMVLAHGTDLWPSEALKTFMNFRLQKSLELRNRFR